MNEEKQHNKKALHQDSLKWIIVGLVGIVVITFIFSAGMWIGGAKAKYSYRWAENYHKNFGGPRGGFLDNWRSFPHGDFIEGHGAFGEIIELNDLGFVIKGRGDVEKIIITSEGTVMKMGRKTVEDGLKVGNSVTIIGSPNEEGQIEAKLIRVFNGEEIRNSHQRSRFPFFK